MATAQHPTIESDDEADRDDTERTRRDDDRPGVGVAHPTVVPTNYEED